MKYNVDVEVIENGEKVTRTYTVIADSESEKVEIDYNGVCYTVYPNPSGSGIMIGTNFSEIGEASSACLANLAVGASIDGLDGPVYSFECDSKFDTKILNTIMRIYQQAKVKAKAKAQRYSEDLGGYSKNYGNDIPPIIEPKK